MTAWFPRSAWDFGVEPDGKIQLVNGSAKSATTIHRFDAVSSLFPSGKHKGRSIATVSTTDPDYILWCASNVPHWRFDEHIIRLATNCKIIDNNGRYR